MDTASVYETLLLLTPQDVPGVGKRRIGGTGDGGYVLLDRLRPGQVVMSFGVGPTVTFDRELAEQGHAILLFDHTIDALPDEHPNFSWHREGIAGTDAPDRMLYSLATHMEKLPPGTVDPILKMDVEGAEWDSLAATPPGLLARFAQITLELHDLLTLHDPIVNAKVQQTLRTLAIDFAPVHVHGNNFGTLGSVAGFACVETLEITYARRDLFETTPSQTWYPTPLDTPNFDERPDFKLWFFPFFPVTSCLTHPSTVEKAPKT